MPQLSKVHYNLSAKDVKQLTPEFVREILESNDGRDALKNIGFDASMKVLRDMSTMYAADSLTQPVTTSSIPNLVQFLQNWLPGVVNIMTARRKIDEIVGIATIGAAEDEQIVQTVVENQGYALPYTDLGNVPLSNTNVNYVARTVVRFESGMMVNHLEESRLGRSRIDAAGQKRLSCTNELEIARNLVGFNGYNGGNNNTYGFLNDTSLGAYITVANPGGGTTWANKTTLQIIEDILLAVVQLRTQSKEAVDPDTDDLTLAVAANAVDLLRTPTQFAFSVLDWLKTNYPKIRVVSAVQLNAANGGAGVFYLFADKVNDGMSSDGGDTFIQVVPAKFQVLGVQQMAKGYIEDYINATAGTMCKRPIAVVRYSGIS